MNVNVQAYAGVFTASPATKNKREARETSENAYRKMRQWT